MKQAMLVVFSSSDEGKTWEPVHPQEVPEWLKAPEVMGRLVAGDMAKNDLIATIHPVWYRAEEVTRH